MPSAAGRRTRQEKLLRRCRSPRRDRNTYGWPWPARDARSSRVIDGGRVIRRADPGVLGGPSSRPWPDSTSAPSSGSIWMYPLWSSSTKVLWRCRPVISPQQAPVHAARTIRQPDLTAGRSIGAAVVPAATRPSTSHRYGCCATCGPRAVAQVAGRVVRQPADRARRVWSSATMRRWSWSHDWPRVPVSRARRRQPERGPRRALEQSQRGRDHFPTATVTTPAASDASPGARRSGSSIPGHSFPKALPGTNGRWREGTRPEGHFARRCTTRDRIRHIGSMLPPGTSRGLHNAVDAACRVVASRHHISIRAGFSPGMRVAAFAGIRQPSTTSAQHGSGLVTAVPYQWRRDVGTCPSGIL